MVKRITNSLLVALCSIIGLSAHGQQPIDVSKYELDRSVKQKKHHAKITLTNGQVVKGTIKAIDYYSIQLEDAVYKRSHRGHPPSDNLVINNEVQYGNIQKIKIRNIGASIAGFVVGTTVGSVVGGLVGLLSPCDDCEPEERLGKSAIFAALGGIVIGPYAAFDGPFIVNRTIDGQYNNYETFRNEMEKRRIKKMKVVKKEM